MSRCDEIRERIGEIEKQPEGRLRTLRLNGLRVLLARFEREEAK